MCEFMYGLERMHWMRNRRAQTKHIVKQFKIRRRSLWQLWSESPLTSLCRLYMSL